MPVKAAQSATKVAHPAVKEQSSGGCKDRVTEISMQWRHCALFYPAAEPVSHHELISPSEFRKKGIQIAEIIAVV